MSRLTRATWIGVGLMLAIVLFLLLRPEADDGAATAPATTEAAEPPAVETAPAGTSAQPPPPQPEPEPTAVNVRLVVERGRPQGGRPRRLAVMQGRTIVLIVDADAPDEVHVHGYDISRPISPRQPTRIRFVADTAGRFVVELERTHVQIAELEVRP